MTRRVAWDRVLPVVWVLLTSGYVAWCAAGGADWHSVQRHNAGEFQKDLRLPAADIGSMWEPFFRWDAWEFLEIVQSGYGYDPGRPSSVAFFPGYPLVAQAVGWPSGLSSEAALMLVSQGCLCAVFLLLPGYLRLRSAAEMPVDSLLVVLACGLWPTSFFWRMPYSESLFLLWLLLVMLGVKKRWPVFVVAILAGCASGTRAVGLACLPVTIWYLCQLCGSWREFFRHALWVGPLAVWGLLAFMLYQQVRFGNAFAFLQTQQLWAMRPAATWSQLVVGLISLEPIWSVYVPWSPAYWARHDPGISPICSLQFANPVYFTLTVFLVGFGAWRRWLTSHELLLSAGLLFIPYVTHSDRTLMVAEGRYASVVFPAYIVMGHILSRLPTPIAAVWFATSAALLGLYSSLFAAWYRMI